ncbi:phage portal protein [Larkinella ripae]
MNYFQRAFNWALPTEKRSTTIGTDAPDEKLMRYFGLNTGKVTVTQNTILTLPVLYRCADVLSSTFAGFPWDLMYSDGDVSKKATGHPCSFVKTRPYPLQSSFVWRKTLFLRAFLQGNGIARIERNGIYRPTKLKIYDQNDVTITRKDDELFYKFNDVKEQLPSSEVIHYKLFSTDGITGRSIIQQQATLKLGLQGMRFHTTLLENGSQLSGVLTHPGKLGTEAKERARGGWFNKFHGLENAGQVAILDEGMKYEQIGVNPIDAQLLEVMKLTKEDVCTMCGVQPHIVGILDRATNNNIEHQGIEFVTHTMMPHVINFEQECDYKLLRSQEQGSYYYKLNMNGLLRGDTEARKEYYQTMRMAGIMNANEIRALEDMNPYEGGERYMIQGAMVPVDKLDEIIASRKPAQPSTPPASRGVELNGHHKNGHTVN